jgi:hypothetical protein
VSQPDPFAPPAGSTPSTSSPAPGSSAAGVSGGQGVWGGSGPTVSVPDGLATWSVAVASVWSAVQVLMLASSSGAAEEYARAVVAGGSAGDVWTTYDSLGTLLIPVQLAAFVVTCLWLQRSRELALAVRPRERHARGAVWVWLGWVVPVVAFWFPFQVVRDVRTGATGFRGRPGLGLWWASWLVMLVVSNWAANVASGRGDPAVLPALEGLATLAIVVCLWRWVRIVREVTAAQRSVLADPRGPVAPGV